MQFVVLTLPGVLSFAVPLDCSLCHLSEAASICGGIGAPFTCCEAICSRGLATLMISDSGVWEGDDGKLGTIHKWQWNLGALEGHSCPEILSNFPIEPHLEQAVIKMLS